MVRGSNIWKVQIQMPVQVGEGKQGEKGEKQYAEYFMPVNEHKKSLRGEKMYVNKSSEKTGGCRKAWFFNSNLNFK